jgi:hypothetical protein
VTSSIARFIGAETNKGTLATLGHGAVIAVTRIPAIIYVAPETVWAVEPWSDTDKHTVNEKIRPVVAIRGAIVGCIVEVPVGTYGLGTDVDADTDLSRHVGAAWAKETQQTEQYKKFD